MGQSSYKLIVTIVKKGKGAKVVDISKNAGAMGSTLLFGHDSAVKLMLGISIEPERDVVWTLAGEDKAQNVMDALIEGLELNEPHKGIALVLSLDQIAGLHRDL